MNDSVGVCSTLQFQTFEREAQHQHSNQQQIETFNGADIVASPRSALIKRGADMIIASLALLLLSPLLIAIAVLIRAESPGPILFKQPRYGFGERIFNICKFRTMRVHMTDAVCERQTSRDDVRLTRVGSLLRKHSLDELPQLFNVLRGEMSVVGPRPHALSTRVEGLLLDDAVAGYTQRFFVKPGITGWAQVNGWRGELDTIEKLRQRLQFDLDYIARGSLTMDLWIIWLTFLCVIRDPHAY